MLTFFCFFCLNCIRPEYSITDLATIPFSKRLSMRRKKSKATSYEGASYPGSEGANKSFVRELLEPSRPNNTAGKNASASVKGLAFDSNSTAIVQDNGGRLSFGHMPPPTLVCLRAATSASQGGVDFHSQQFAIPQAVTPGGLSYTTPTNSPPGSPQRNRRNLKAW